MIGHPLTLRRTPKTASSDMKWAPQMPKYLFQVACFQNFPPNGSTLVGRGPTSARETGGRFANLYQVFCARFRPGAAIKWVVGQATPLAPPPASLAPFGFTYVETH